MRLFFLRHRWESVEPSLDDVKGLREAKDLLQQAQQESPEVARIVRETRRRRVENHFGDKFARAFFATKERHS